MDWCSLLAVGDCCLTFGKSPLSELFDLHNLVWLHMIIVCTGVTPDWLCDACA